jgi:hypothetical protein
VKNSRSCSEAGPSSPLTRPSCDESLPNQRPCSKFQKLELWMHANALIVSSTENHERETPTRGRRRADRFIQLRAVVAFKYAVLSSRLERSRQAFKWFSLAASWLNSDYRHSTRAKCFSSRRRRYRPASVLPDRSHDLVICR